MSHVKNQYFFFIYFFLNLFISCESSKHNGLLFCFILFVLFFWLFCFNCFVLLFCFIVFIILLFVDLLSFCLFVLFCFLLFCCHQVRCRPTHLCTHLQATTALLLHVRTPLTFLLRAKRRSQTAPATSRATSSIM